MPEPPNVPTDLTLVRNTESETRLIPASGSLSVIFFQHETMGISGISNKQQKLSEEATLLHGSQTPGREPLRSKTPSSVHLGLSSVTADLSQARVTKRQKLLFIASGALLVFVGALITYLLY